MNPPANPAPDASSATSTPPRTHTKTGPCTMRRGAIGRPVAATGAAGAGAEASGAAGAVSCRAGSARSAGDQQETVPDQAAHRGQDVRRDVVGGYVEHDRQAAD